MNEYKKAVFAAKIVFVMKTGVMGTSRIHIRGNAECDESRMLGVDWGKSWR